jgi:hypothetical protein
MVIDPAWQVAAAPSRMGTGASPGLFGVLLLRYRVAAGLSQEERAARAGLSRRGISELASRRCNGRPVPQRSCRRL